MKPTPCKVYGSSTSTVFNIDFKAVRICESCAESIFIQQAHWYVSRPEAAGLAIAEPEKNEG
jgi:hypothetical protein